MENGAITAHSFIFLASKTGINNKQTKQSELFCKSLGDNYSQFKSINRNYYI